MNTLLSARLAPFATAAILAFASLTAHADTFTVSYLAPGAQAPASGSYETFDSFSAGTGLTSIVTSVGTITGTFDIIPAGTYGGAGGTGNYFAIEDGNSATLALSSPSSTFGLWISALDGGNTLTFYNGTTVVSSFDAAQLIAGVGACPSASGYCGNPNDGYQDNYQQFAYTNFVDTTGTFTSVVIAEVNQPASNFELDNVTLAAQGSGVGTLLATPEPSSFLLLGTGVTALAGVVRRRRR